MEKAGGVGVQVPSPAAAQINVGEIRGEVLSESYTQNEAVPTEETKVYVEEKIDNHVGKSESATFAEELFERAKSEGEDAAFEMMASDDVAENKNKEIKEDVKRDEDELADENIKKKKEEKPAIEEKISRLEDKVRSLTEENRKLKERVGKVEQTQLEALSSAYELAALLKKLLEENEELKKKNVDIVEVLAQLMAKILALMIVDERGARKKEEEKPVIEKQQA